MSSSATLKAGWTRVAFGDVIRLVRERSPDPQGGGFERYVGLEHMDPGDLTIRRWGNVADGTTFTNVFRAGQVLFGKRRAYQRKVAVANFDGICSGDIYVFESKSEHLLPELLPFVCQTDRFFEHAVGTSAGSLSPRTNWSSLAAFEFPLPPIDEQRRIVVVLVAIEGANEALRRVHGTEELLERALFDQWASDSDGPVVELRSTLLEPPRNGYSAVEATSPTGHWVLALSALTKAGYRHGELKPVEKSNAVVAASLTKGDLLISRSNTRELVGLPGIFDEDRTDVSWPDTMMRLRPDPTRLRPAYLEHLLRSTEGRRQIQSFAAGTSASMKKINAINVQKLRFPVPSVQRQDEVIRMLDRCRATRTQLLQRREGLGTVKSNLFRAIFTERL